MRNQKKWQMVLALVSIAVVLLLFWLAMKKDTMLTSREAAWLDNHGPLIYGANEYAPPLRFVDTDGQYKGVVVDYMNQLSLELGIEIKTVPYRWEEALKKLTAGETDICDMYASPERAKQFLFTEPIYNLRTSLVVRAGDDIGLEDIDHLTIATEKGDYANRYLETNYPKAKLVYVSNVGVGMDLLLEGKVDAAIGDEPIITYLIGKRKDSWKLKFINTALYEEEVVLAVPKSEPQLVEILNKGIRSVNQKGQLEKIQQKWFGISTPLKKVVIEGSLLRMFLIPAMALLLLFVFISWNNYSLKQQVKERTKELEGSKNELQIIFDGITEYMAVVDEHCQIVTANRGFAAYLSKEVEDIDHHSCKDCLHRFCSDCENCQIKETMRLGKTTKREIMVDNSIFEMLCYPLEGSHNEVLVSLKNITLEKINRNQILQSTKMIAVGQLAGGMAHEIRNPLGVIRTQSYLLRMGEDLDENSIRSLNYIDASVDRAGTIIDNLLNFSRLSGNQMDLVDLAESIRTILFLQNDDIRKKKIDVTVSCEGTERVRINQESLKHILLNLISNAIDAMDVYGKLHISAQIGPTDITITCEDNGCGIDEKHMEKLFNPFFTTKEVGKGTGLGLYIVYTEVEKCNGKIVVQSEVGKGTQFIITLPKQMEEKDERIV